MTCWIKYWRGIFTMLTVVITLASTAPTAFAAGANPGVLPPGSHAYGNTYAEWSARWWQYVLSFPAATNPLFDTTGAACAAGQHGKVFFLVGSFTGPVVRDECIVPAGVALFFPMINIVDVNTDSQTADELRAEIAPIEDGAYDLHAAIDGVAVSNPAAYRTKSTVFSLLLPADNLFGLPAGAYAPAVADGYYLLLAPLPPGPHTITFGGTDGVGFSQDITYHITVQQPHP